MDIWRITLYRKLHQEEQKSHSQSADSVPAGSVLYILEGRLGLLKPTALRARTLKV